jgi:hypothetical protein
VSDYFSSGLAVDVILAIVAVELLIVLRWKRRKFADFAIGALPGLCLLLALRAALTDADWPWVALWLTLSLPAHMLDARRRLR